jgi:hypothetical protein
VDTIDSQQLPRRDGFDIDLHIVPDYDSTPHDADCYSAEDICEWQREAWMYVGIVVTASRGGVELGQSSLWGVEHGDMPKAGTIDAFRHEAVPDLIGEAVADATRRLAQITDSGTWYRREPFYNTDAGDLGGDDQAGPAHTVSWQRKISDSPSLYETVTVAYYAANDRDGITRDPIGWHVMRQVEWVEHTNPSDPGGSEQRADYHYRLTPTGSPLWLAELLALEVRDHGEPQSFRNLFEE